MRQTSYRCADFIILTMALAVALAIVVAAVSWAVKRANGPRLLSALAEQVVFVMVPPLLLIFLVLGTIFIGVATPTEGGAMGAVGAMLLASAKRLSDGNPARFSLDIVRSAAQRNGEAVGVRDVHPHRRAHLLARPSTA